MPIWALLTTGAMIHSSTTWGQDSANLNPVLYDTSYYKGYKGYFTGRLYSGNKYLGMTMVPQGEGKSQSLSFSPNTNITLGVGATYKWLTLNLAYGFDFVNRSRNRRGDTRYIDLQAHLYGRRNILDIYGQFYKGYYANFPILEGGGFALRPQMRINQVGLLYEHLANWQHFSMRASMLQSEQQLKSAGSLLYGGSAYYTTAKSDSGLLFEHPSLVGYPNVNRFSNFSIGPSLGYGYTLVIKKRYFLTGTATANPTLNFAASYMNNGSKNTISVRPSFMIRTAAGYSSFKWSIAAFWINDGVLTSSSDYRYNFNTGMLRIAFSYRFLAGPKLQHRLRVIEAFEEKVIKKMKAKLPSQSTR